MSTPEISDKAVSAAKDALFAVFEHGNVDFWLERNGDRHIIEGRVNLKEAIREVLAAAAPHLMAQAYDIGFEHGRDRYFTEPTNPYRASWVGE